MRHIIVDISRTVMRAAHAAPTGIDRVERAYIEWALEQTRYEVAFLCRIKGAQALFDRANGEKIFHETRFRRQRRSGFIETRTERRWRGLVTQARAFRRATGWFRSVSGGRAAFARLGLEPSQTMIVNVSHNNINPSALDLLKGVGVAKFVAFVHDVIPVDYPEFVVANGARQFSAKLDALAKHADAFIFNSQYTSDRSLIRFAERSHRRPPSMIAHLGLSDIWEKPYEGPPLSAHPYFVTLGTIEPRKNHLLLLNIWRRLAESLPNPPHLHVIGWRGWENENILDFLDRSSVMGQSVFEHPSDSDERVKGWIAGAQAVLYPTFVEGFGIPIVEALVSGTPVICSDLPVLREVGGDAPDYIDPLDGPGWEARIRAYRHNDHPLRLSQLDRIQNYAPPTWRAHLAEVEQFLWEVAES
ncbi:MAG: glycosyltransferase family 4 protein [Rhodobacteraceae bacterium]|nr:glycosyltransferase family 4 protein [Paracoccaceae bacterium]